jgi:hypothetical protein
MLMSSTTSYKRATLIGMGAITVCVGGVVIAKLAPAQAQATVQPPVIRFQKVTGPHSNGLRALTFEVNNPNVRPIRYVGYLPSSFGKDVDLTGKMSPIYAVKFQKAGKWKSLTMGWCGTGSGGVELQAHEKATFDVWLQKDGALPGASGEKGWESLRIGVSWMSAAKGQAAEAWSDVVPRSVLTAVKK